MIQTIVRLHKKIHERSIVFLGAFFFVLTCVYAGLFIFDFLPATFKANSVFFGPLLLLLTATPWVIFSLLSTLGDAGVGYVDEYLLKEIKKTGDTNTDAPGRLLLLSGFFGFVVLSITAVVSLFLGAEYSIFVTLESFLLSISAGFLEVLWLIPYFYALQRGGALNTTPLFQTVPIFSLIFGLILFSEVPVPLHILATFLIIAGAALLNYSPVSRKLDVISILLMLASSATISMGYFIFKDATESGNFVASVFGNGLGMALCSTLIWMFWKPYRQQFNQFIQSFTWKIFTLQFSNESLYAVSAVLGQLAIVLGPSVMIVSAFSAFHPLFTLLIGLCITKFGVDEASNSLSGPRLIAKTVAIILISTGTFVIFI